MTRRKGGREDFIGAGAMALRLKDGCGYARTERQRAGGNPHALKSRTSGAGSEQPGAAGGNAAVGEEAAPGTAAMS